jgi:hypothetical protein
MSLQPYLLIRSSTDPCIKWSGVVYGPRECDRAAFDALVATTRAEHPDAELPSETMYADGHLEAFVVVCHKTRQSHVVTRQSVDEDDDTNNDSDNSHAAWATRTERWIHRFLPSSGFTQHALAMLHSMHTAGAEQRRQFQLSLDALVVSVDAFKRAHA